MSKRLRFGVLGCGGIAPHHAWAIKDLGDEAELVAVADMLPDRAERFAGEWQADWHDNAAALLGRGDIDAVAICTPSGLHGELAAMAMTAGKDVVIEKPVEITTEAVDRLLAVQRSTGRTAAVIFQHRWDMASRIVHEAATAGRFGRLTTGTAQMRWWRSQAYYDSGDWRGTWAMDGGGALMNQAIHTIDLLLWSMGPVTEVTAFTALRAHERIEVEDAAVAALRFQSGALGLIEATTAAYPGLSARLEVHGDLGSAIIDDNRLTYFHAATAGVPVETRHGLTGNTNQAEALLRQYQPYGPDPAAATSYPARSVAHREQYRDFITAVRTGRPPLVTITEGRAAVAVIQAIYESARTGRPAAIH